MKKENCTSCKKEFIKFRHFETGKKNPIEVKPHSKGNLVLNWEKGIYRFATPEEIEQAKIHNKNLYISHFATCPDAKSFRADKKKSAQEKFNEYDRANPQVYEMFKKLAMQVKRIGFKRFSAEMIVNQIRWKSAIKTKNDDFKINNNYKAFLSRKLMQEVPEMEGFFETRKSKADE